MDKININLGKGVILSAPFKRNMTAEEWTRMVSYINGLLNKTTTKISNPRNISITKR